MTLNYQKDITVRHRVDVFVAGGGPAGMAAATAAARSGAKVFLAEGLGAFGGVGTSAGIPLLCRPTDGINFLAAGFGEEVYERMWKAGGANPEMEYRKHPEEIGGFIYNPETLKRVYDEIASETGFQFSFNTALIDVVVENKKITHAVCAAKSGIFAVEAAIFIDATGDGDLAAMAGAEFERGNAAGLTQAATLCSLWSGIDWSRKVIWTDGKELPRAIGQNIFSIPDLGLPGILHTLADCGWGNVGHIYDVDGTDERTVTRGLIRGRKLVLEYERYYRQFVPGCENARMLLTAQTLGIRESRRITGDYVLCVDDFHRQAIFEDEIGRFAYPVDLHRTSCDEPEEKVHAIFQTLRYKNPGENYGIPYRSLLPRALDNVLVAGRCISADRYMIGSIRVQAGCYITGQAAGVAAALAADRQTNPRDLEIADIQKLLVANGAFLPNYRIKAS